MAGRSHHKRAVVGVLSRIGSRLMPMDADLMGAIVDQHGVGTSLKFLLSDAPAYNKVMDLWGPIRTHLLAIAISVDNGCEWCARGHSQAFQLHFFATTGDLFFIDEERMIAAARNGRARAIKTFERSLIESGLEDEVEVLQRLFYVADEGASGSQQDQRFLDVLKVVDFVNGCDVAPDYEQLAAHDTIYQDARLRARYEQARKYFV